MTRSMDDKAYDGLIALKKEYLEKIQGLEQEKKDLQPEPLHALQISEDLKPLKPVDYARIREIDAELESLYSLLAGVNTTLEIAEKGY